MTAREIGSIVLRVQEEFLDTPALQVTLPDAERRFGLDPVACHAVLGTLVDSQVLTRTRDGVYLRYYAREARAA
jgi:hypothetical protein